LIFDLSTSDRSPRYPQKDRSLRQLLQDRVHTH
jgi:hypothetical protein